MKWIALCLAILAPKVHGEIAKSDWILSKGKLTYHVRFPLKKVEGISETVKGKGHCDGQNCEFLVASPVKSFESGDGNRDNHMLEVTKAGPFPMISVRIKIPKSTGVDSFNTDAEINFAGQSHIYKVSMKTRSEKEGQVVSGTVPLKLSDFKIERPALLAVKIDDEVPVDFELVWK